jgi:hypothetical protein
MNMRELGVRLAQLNGDIDVCHIEGKRNSADTFTKEIKDASHFQQRHSQSPHHGLLPILRHKH